MDKLRKTPSQGQFHTINGYVNSTLAGATGFSKICLFQNRPFPRRQTQQCRRCFSGLAVCQKSPLVSWHLIGLGSTPDIHSIQFEGHTLKVLDHKRVMVEMTPMTFTTALMKPTAAGRFLISCKIHSHQTGETRTFTLNVLIYQSSDTDTRVTLNVMFSSWHECLLHC